MTDASATHDRNSARAAILEYVRSADYRPMRLTEILRRLRVPSGSRVLYRRAATELLREGRLTQRGGRLANARDSTAGEARGSRDGAGAERKGRAATGRESRRGARGGRIDDARADGGGLSMLGVFRRGVRGAGRVESFDPAAPTLVVSASDAGGAKDGQAVLAERGGDSRGREAGRVVEVLGTMGDPGMDVRIVAHRHGFALEFPTGPLEEAHDLDAAIHAAGPRERFDDPAPVTIDGATAQDFDDAVAVAPLPRGGFRLFVHIADVAHFVRPATAIDAEALARGTSVYFPGRVLPMLPERLSNELCSLRPGEDRLVQSAIVDLDRMGAVRKVRFADGVIRSAARLTYPEVSEILEGGEGRRAGSSTIPPMLHLADRLREVLERRRRARGSVDFDLPEPQILLDVEGVMTGVAVEPRNRAHRMIEEFMLVANEAVAGHLHARGAPCLYRVHERPDPVKVEALAGFVRSLGLRLPGNPEALRPQDLQALLEAAEERPEYPILAQVALRTMRQARYTPENVGHFGLAAPVYAHFTSPIRRYPDLVVHRLLRAVRRGAHAETTALAEGLEAVGDRCSKLERAAEAAERELLEWKKIAFIASRVGDDFDGIVTGVARFGLFVRLTESLVEGLLRVERLGAERFEHDERRLELRGTRSSRTFRLGDRVRVLLERVDTVLRRADFSLLLEAQGRPARGGRAAAPQAKRRGPSRPAKRRAKK